MSLTTWCHIQENLSTQLASSGGKSSLTVIKRDNTGELPNSCHRTERNQRLVQAKPQVTAARPIYTRWCQGHIEVLGSRVRVIQEHALSKMVQCSPNKSKCVQNGKTMSLFFQNGPKWSKMVKIGSKRSNMVHTFTKLFKMLQNGQKWSKDQ